MLSGRNGGVSGAPNISSSHDAVVSFSVIVGSSSRNGVVTFSVIVRSPSPDGVVTFSVISVSVSTLNDLSNAVVKEYTKPLVRES